MTIKLPSISDVRADVEKHFEKNFSVKIATKAQLVEARSEHVANQIVVLPTSAGSYKGECHQIDRSLSASNNAYMPNAKLFSSTGLFAPADINSSEIQISKAYDSKYRPVVGLLNAVTRELSRRAAAGNDKPFTSAELMQNALKDGSEFGADIDTAVASGKPSSVIANWRNKGFTATRECVSHVLTDLFVCGGVVLPCGGDIRRATTERRINASWLKPLAEAAVINGAVQAAASQPDTQAAA
jgi:hypothetical protein